MGIRVFWGQVRSNLASPNNRSGDIRNKRRWSLTNVRFAKKKRACYNGSTAGRSNRAALTLIVLELAALEAKGV